MLYDRIDYIEQNQKRHIENLNNTDFEYMEELNSRIDDCLTNISEIDNRMVDLNRRVSVNNFLAENSNYEKVFIKLKNIKIIDDKIYFEYETSNFFTGEEAIKKYAKDHDINENEVHLGNGFYIKETGENTTRLSEDALIILLNIMEQEYEISTFEDLELHLENRSLWYNIYIVDERIELIEEFYIP
jgi:hypothetical protein